MFYRARRLLRRILASRQRRGGQFQWEGAETMARCGCCGSTNLKQVDILWHDLIDGWGLSEREAHYVNRQQGGRCADCGARIRSMALAEWMLDHYALTGPLDQAVKSSSLVKTLSVLEINKAGQLTPYLQAFGTHILGEYPDVDMQALRFADGSFDLVIHSDTLEHVPDPVLALRECRRVLKPGGACAFTVPMIVDRPSRSTSASLPTYHGDSGTRTEDFRVRTEFGVDTWKYMAAAGFKDCRIHVVEFPAATVHVGIR